jgi:hypothetical protein
MAELRTFLSIVPSPSAAHLHQPVSVRMDELTSFRLGGECHICVFKDIVATQMNQSVRLDMWSLHLPHHQSEEANLPSMIVSLIDEDGISTTLLSVIKNNPQIMNMYEVKMLQNIQRLRCYALDGNTSLLSLVVHIDDDEDEDDNRESIESNNYNNNNNNRVTAPIHQIDMLIKELASFKNGLNLRVVSLDYDDDEDDRDLIALGESDIQTTKQLAITAIVETIFVFTHLLNCTLPHYCEEDDKSHWRSMGWCY